MTSPTNTPRALSEAQMAEAIDSAEWFIKHGTQDFKVGETYKIMQAFLASRAEVERLRTALNPRMWDARMSAAWHVAIPDLQVAFDAIRSIAAQDKENGNG